jgi:hypothetical protein
MYRRWYRCHVDLSAFSPLQDGILKVPAAGISPEQFRQQYDQTSTPVMLKGAISTWPLAKLSLQPFIYSFGSKSLQVSKPGGGKLKMDLAVYGDYMQRQHDEEPLYVFDAAFGETAPELLDLYSVPEPFDQDFTAVLGE